MAIVQLKENNDLYEATGVRKFHEAGYFGERVNAASGELWNLSEYNPDNLCSSPTGKTESSNHGRETASIFFQVAPKAHLYSFNSSGKFGSTAKYNGKTYECDIMSDIFPNIDKLNITAMFTSLSIYGNNEFREDYSKEMSNHPNFCSCFAAGNDGEDSYNRMIRVDEIFSIGGFVLSGKDKKPTFNNSSSYTDNANYIDFCGPWNAYSYYSNSNSPNFLAGTSIATPWICGMICLVNDFFIDKTGKPLTREKMKQFLIDCCYDLEEEGEDYKSGWGIPVLPSPDSIDIYKYAEKLEEDEDDDETPLPEPDPEPEPEPPEEDNNEEYVEYTVKAGDTLYTIAKTYLNDGNKYKEIMKLNGLVSTLIYKGQVLKIPCVQEEMDEIDSFIKENNLTIDTKPYIKILLECGVIELNNFNLNDNMSCKDFLNNAIQILKYLNK